MVKGMMGMCAGARGDGSDSSVALVRDLCNWIFTDGSHSEHTMDVDLLPSAEALRLCIYVY